MLKNLKDLGQMVAREVEATPYSIMFLSLSTLPACDALTMMCCELGSVWIGIKKREKTGALPRPRRAILTSITDPPGAGDALDRKTSTCTYTQAGS